MVNWNINSIGLTLFTLVTCLLAVTVEDVLYWGWGEGVFSLTPNRIKHNLFKFLSYESNCIGAKLKPDWLCKESAQVLMQICKMLEWKTRLLHVGTSRCPHRPNFTTWDMQPNFEGNFFRQSIINCFKQQSDHRQQQCTAWYQNEFCFVIKKLWRNGIVVTFALLKACSDIDMFWFLSLRKLSSLSSIYTPNGCFLLFASPVCW